MPQESSHAGHRSKKKQTTGPSPAALAGIGATVSPEAEAFLRTSPILPVVVEHMVQILRQTIEDGAPFTSVMLETVTEPENLDWTEVVFSIGVQADFDETMRWWRKIGARHADLNKRLPERERAILARNVGVHLVPEIGGNVRPN